MFERILQRFLHYQMTHSFAMYKRDVDIKDHVDMQDTESDPEKRARNLLDRMTSEEKISYIGGYDDLAIRGIERLGIPAVYASDATSGVRCFGPATIFPANIALTASWNMDLIRRVGDVIGEEARAKGVSILLAPGVNIARVPTCGRNFEYMGEDPYLAGEMAASYILGVQGRGVITTVKHFACNNSDYDRHKSDSIVDERTLHELYLPAFKKAVQKGGSLGVMSSYNQINGVYASEHGYLLTEVLRGQWGFKGFVMSDWTSVYSTDGPIKNGLDIEMPKAVWLTEDRVRQAMRAGLVEESDIDVMVFRLLRTLISAGVFDRTAIDADADFLTEDHHDTARQAADEGVVLLKNERGLLPLDRTTLKRIVIAGRNGLNPVTGGGGSSYILPDSNIRGIYDAVRLSVPGASVEYIESIGGLVDERDIPFVSDADAVIIATGFDQVTESECFDRSWKLPDHEDRLIAQLSAVNSRCVVILHGGGDMECASWIGPVPAVMHAMYLGEQSGSAVARVLFGETNPSGKLPFSMVREWDDIAATHWYVKHPERMNPLRVIGPRGNPRIRRVTPMEYGEGLMVGYRHLDTNDIEPLFPFGFGLSYTQFELSGLEISQHDGVNVTVSCTVRNIGGYSGAEVVQVYVHDEESAVFRPAKELKGFEKVFLDPGEEERVAIELDRDSFSYYSAEHHEWHLEPGSFVIQVGTSSRQIVLESRVNISCG